MAENQNKTKKELLGERLKAKYPDMDLTDEEALYGRIGEDMDGYEKSIEDYKGREDKLTELFSKDPRAAKFLTDLAKGNDPWISVIERLGIDGVTELLNDPSKQELYAEANKKYVESVAKSKELDEQYDTNFKESMAMVDKFKQEKGISDETMDAAFEFLNNVYSEYIVGKFSRDVIEMAVNAVNHEADMDNARTEGTIAGRNAKIEEKLRKRNAGDGMPVMGGSNNAATQQKQSRSMFDLAGEAR